MRFFSPYRGISSLLCRRLHCNSFLARRIHDRSSSLNSSKLRNSAYTGARIPTMASEAARPHGSSLEKPDLNEASQQFPDCYPERNPIDVYRAHLAIVLSKVTGVDARTIYPTIAWTQTLDKGDLVLAVPALRIKGQKPNDLAAKWVDEVRLRT